MTRLFTYGYLRGSVDDLREYTGAGALILDIRFAPWSRHPDWRRGALVAALGQRYEWCGALGNKNYRGGPIEIADPDAGLRRVR